LDSLREELPSIGTCNLEGVTLVMGEKRDYRVELAAELGVKLVEREMAKNLIVWSSHAEVSLQKYFLTGDSLTPGHRWSLSQETLKKGAENHPAVEEDKLCGEFGLRCGSVLRYPNKIDWSKFLWEADDVVVIDFERAINLYDLGRLKLLAKARRAAVLVCSEVLNERGGCYEEDTFAGLAMALGVEKGVNLTRCVNQVIALYPWKRRVGATAIYNPPASCEVRLLRPDVAPVDFRFLSWFHYAQLLRVQSY